MICAVVLVVLALVAGEFPAAQASMLPREAAVLGDAPADEPTLTGQRCISIAVFAQPDIKDSLVNRVAAEAETIWKPTGIRFEWHRHTSDDPAPTWQVAVTIDDRREGATEWQAALGWIRFTPTGPAASIHLSRADAETLISRTPGVKDVTLITHETLMGRALGRALSHELGHYLLRSKVHTSHGLMRARWPSSELLSIDPRGFELTSEELAASGLLQRGPN